LKRVRIDSLLSQRGIFPSRSRAAASVLAGDVRLPGGRRVEKPGELVPEDVELEVTERPQFASRGGTKLANALDQLGLEVAGRHALDVGASTGGFTDCLLQRGVSAVTAVDVAYGELDWRLRSDERVTAIERKNARFLESHKVLPAVLGSADERFDCLALVKPQFEAGRGQVGKGGVVRDPAVRRQALVGVGRAALKLGVSVLAYASSGLPGPKGNRETFIWLAEPGRDGIEDLEQAAAEADA
jgi:23S rRNA (cytidine1920-2'-O)/16S rRNA (cytidine1409-2'-O)-methyltransferase